MSLGEEINIGTQYGSLVVGEEEAKRQAQIRELTSGQTYGTLVIGDDKAAELAILVAKGEIVIEQPAPPVPTAPTSAPDPGSTITDDQAHIAPPDLPQGPPSYSLEQISQILADQPDMLDALVDAEIARPEGPRPQAVEVFIIAAQGAAREENFVEALKALV